MKLQISLRRVMLLVAFIAAALGFFRFAALCDDERAGLAVVVGLFFVGSALGIFSKYPMFYGLLLLYLLLIAFSVVLLLSEIFLFF